MKRLNISLLVFFLLPVFLTSCFDQSSNDDYGEEEWQSDSMAMLEIIREELETAAPELLAYKLRNLLLADTIKLDSVNIVLEAGADLNQAVKYTSSFSYNRPVQNLPVVGKYFKGGSGVEIRNMPALQMVLFSGGVHFEKAAELLLIEGADPNTLTEDEFSMTAVDMCLYKEYSTEFIDLLLNHGVDLQKVNLAWAGDDLGMINYLVNKGGDPKTVDLNAFMNGFAGPGKHFWDIMRFDIDPQSLHPEYIVDLLGFDRKIFNALLDKGLDLNKPIKGQDIYWLCYALDNTNNRNDIFYLLDKGANYCGEGVNPYQVGVNAFYDQDKAVIDWLEKTFGTDSLVAK